MKPPGLLRSIGFANHVFLYALSKNYRKQYRLIKELMGIIERYSEEKERR